VFSGECSSRVRSVRGLPTRRLNAAGNADYILTTDSAPGRGLQLHHELPATEPGGYLVCTWTENAQTVLAGPVTPPKFTARGPQAMLAVSLPVAPTHDRTFTIQLHTQTDQNLDSPRSSSPGATSCAANYSLELDQDGNAATTLTSKPKRLRWSGDQHVDRDRTGRLIPDLQLDPGTRRQRGRRRHHGRRSPSRHPRPSPSSPSVHITHASLSHKHGATIKGTTAPALAGRVEVYVACGKASTSTAPRIADGRFNAHLKLPRTCRRAMHATVGVVCLDQRPSDVSAHESAPRHRVIPSRHTFTL